MAVIDRYINETGLATVRDWANGKFATNSALTAVSGRIDDIVAEGGEPNLINTVTVNGTAVTPDAQKNVALTIPTNTSALTNNGDGVSPFATQSFVEANGGKIDKIQVNGAEQTISNKTVNITVPTKVSELQNDGDGTSGSAFATQSYVQTNGGKIDKIKVNGVEQSIAVVDKSVNVVVPTTVSQLTNDSDFQTLAQVNTLINNAVISAYTYKGTVATVSDLPTTGNKVGDIYEVLANTTEYAWDGTEWGPMGQYIDESLLWAKSELVAMTVAEVNAILNPSTP